jgi:hypothetical protein
MNFDKTISESCKAYLEKNKQNQIQIIDQNKEIVYENFDDSLWQCPQARIQIQK